MKSIFYKPLYSFIFRITISILSTACVSNSKNQTNQSAKVFPSDVLPFLDEWKILLGDGTYVDSLVKFDKKDFFYVENQNGVDWVVYKTPNSGITSRNSKNTRTELGQLKKWIPETGGKLTGTLKVQHVSTSGDARVAASYSVVVGQIHSGGGHENEPLKIFYKKFPGHKKGSIFWNYEINTAGSNSGRWDFSTAVWGYDMSEVGPSSDVYPEEPEEGIELGEEFSYKVNVYQGMMYLTFESTNQETKTFSKNLLKSDFSNKSDMPEQVRVLYAPLNRDGVERETAYAGEVQYFKQGAYNQTNGKKPEDNIVWSTDSETFDGDISKQYANGCYTEVWFKEGSLGPGTSPDTE
jgi:hypothetical protein